MDPLAARRENTREPHTKDTSQNCSISIVVIQTKVDIALW